MKPTVFNHQQYTDLEADYMILKAENEQLKKFENTILTADHVHRYTRSGLQSLLDQIKELQQVCLEHQQERMGLEAELKQAVEDIYKMTDGECDLCKHYNHDKNTCAQPDVHYDDCFEWRGAKGGAE